MKRNIFKSRMKKIRDPDLNNWELTEDTSGNITASYIGRGNTIVIPPLINGKEYTISTLIKDYDNRDISVVINKNILTEGMFQTYNVTKTFINIASITNKAFNSCTSLINVVMGDNVASIGDSAFEGCTKLQTVIGGKIEVLGQKAFKKCSQLEYVNTSNVSSWGNECFSICTKINNIVISNIDSFTNTGFGWRFNQCKGLNTLDIPKIPNRVGRYDFYAVPYSFPASFFNNLILTESWSFSECTGITEINITNNFFSGVGYGGFANISSVKTLTFPSSPNASTLCCFMGVSFQSCTFTNELILPSNTYYIGDCAFNHCNQCSNTTMNIPASVEVIGGRPNDIDYDSESYNHNIEIAPLSSKTSALDYQSWIGDHTFYDFSNSCNEAFTVGDDGTNESQYFKAIDGVLYGKNRLGVNGIYRLVAYPRAKKDEVYQIEEGVIALDALGFGKNTYCKELILPDSYTITGWENWKSKYVNERDGYPLNFIEGNRYFNSLTIFIYRYNKLERFNVKSTNTKYKAVDGCIYSKDGKSLWAVPHYHGGTITIEEGTEKLEHGSLHNIDMSIVSGLSIPASVNNIPQTVLYIVNDKTRGFIGKMTIDENNSYYMIDEATGKIVSKTS